MKKREEWIEELALQLGVKSVGRRKPRPKKVDPREYLGDEALAKARAKRGD